MVRCVGAGAVSLYVINNVDLRIMLSSELVRSALESAPDAMIIIDSSGSILFVNQQVTALFGYGREEIVGQRIECLLPERFRSGHIMHRSGYAKQVRTRPMGSGLDLFALRKDETEFPVEISLSPIVDGDLVLVAAAIRDVTERVRTQTELHVAREAADEAAERANQAKSRFLATASHDLRQPLQTLALLNGTLRRIAAGPDIMAALSQQEQAIGAMSRLLNALLDISKLESGAIKPELSDFTVAALFEELRTEFEDIATSKGLQLKIESNAVWVHSDPALVGQILRNLVSNAIKYTQEGWVRLNCSHNQPIVRLEVLDTGIGIPGDQLGYIYNEFYQVGVLANASRDGYGLGLSIVQRVVRLLGLRIDVRSEVGKGSTFSLELPESQARIEHRAASAPPVGVGATQRAVQSHILLVEDDPAVSNATRMLLKVEGYRVSTASSVNEALQKANENPRIDVVVTDYHLSDSETGTQVVAVLRRVLGPDLKAVLMTGDTSSAIRDLPLDGYLRLASKPINADAFLALLSELLTA